MRLIPTTNAQMMRLALLAPLLLSLNLQAAPLAWFPGPTLGTPLSGSGTVFYGGKNILSGGDVDAYAGYPITFPMSLAATNVYWTDLSAYSSVNIAAGVVVSDGNLVIYGGSDGTNAESLTINYNISGDTVPGLPNMNVARAYLGSAPDRNGNAYAFGGLDSNGNPLASCEKLNPTASSPAWTYVANLPQARYDFPAVFNRTNYIYLFGGLTDPVSGTEIASVLRYSVSGNSWSNMAAMPVSVAGSAATLGPDGNIYVVGGTSGGISTNLVQVYNPIANSWTISTPLPESLSLAAVGVDSLNRLIVMGGMDTNGNDVADVWRSQPYGVADAAPVITNFPATSATYSNAYTSYINAAGNPPPVYSLVSGPAGMLVDYFSGAITWTPEALSNIGTNPVTVAASNYAGTSNYTFNIVVPNVPPSIPTITVVSTADTYDVISVSPQSPAVGPVTYSIAIPYVSHGAKGSGGSVTYHTITTNIATNVFSVGGVNPGSSASYALSVIGAGGSVGYSYSTWFTVYTTSPQPPASVSLAGVTSTSITLNWTPSPGPAQNSRYSEITNYAIAEYIPGQSAKYWLTGIPTNTLTATLTGLPSGQWHYWYVAAGDAQGVYSGFTGLPSTYVSVSNSIPRPASLAAVSAPPAGGGGFQFTVQPNLAQTTLIQATTNISDPNSWVTIATNPPAGSSFNFTDTNSSQYTIRYYRVISE